MLFFPTIQRFYDGFLGPMGYQMPMVQWWMWFRRNTTSMAVWKQAVWKQALCC
jgi:hypothetical protein